MADIKEIILRSQIAPVGAPKKPDAQKASGSTASFDAILRDAEIKVSKHATKRLDTRQIDLAKMDQEQLKSAIETLEKKGARDSLVLMGDLAFIINVPSKTLVTAISKEQMKEQVFTNIDSTILVAPKE